MPKSSYLEARLASQVERVGFVIGRIKIAILLGYLENANYWQYIGRFTVGDRNKQF